MIIAALISSLCIGLSIFCIDIIFSYPGSWTFLTFIAGFLISLIIISLFGIPSVILLKRFNKLNWKTILASGFTLGFIVSFMLFLASHSSCDNCSSSVNGQVMMENGKSTMAGWISHIEGSAIQGIIGMIASSIFYKALLMRTKKEIKNL
jgi:predicted PurR-regulated permease PerM